MNNHPAKAESTTKQILYVSYDGMTDPLGQSQVIPYLKGLSQLGYTFTLISFEKPDRYQQNRQMIQALLAESGISWVPLTYTKKPPVLSTLYDIYRLIKTVRVLHRQRRFDLMHCRSYIAALAGLRLKRAAGIPFVFDMRGFWADERVDGGLWNLKIPVYKLIYRYFKKKETTFLQEAAIVISLTHAAKAEMLKWNVAGLSSNKIAVIPCCVDTGLFDPNTVTSSAQQLYRQQLGIADTDFIIGYLGSIGTWYMLDEMLQYFIRLQKRIPAARLLFVTASDHALIRQKVAAYAMPLDRVIIKAAGRGEVPLLISLFNYGLFLVKPTYSKLATSPVKQGEIMAMGKPVICNKGIGDTEEIVKRYHSGLCIQIGDDEESINAIAGGLPFDGEAIREGALDYFSLSVGIEAYQRAYESVLK